MINMISYLKKFRPNVGVMVINKYGEVFVGKRKDLRNIWQMPQGGIEPGETNIEAGLRELYEETGITSVTFLAESTKFYHYHFPNNSYKSPIVNKYRGQKQKWVMFLFHGKNTEINLAVCEQEFSDWRWIDRTKLPTINRLKANIYSSILNEFENTIKSTIN